MACAISQYHLDSIVYLTHDDEDRIQCGTFLGDMTDELDGGFIEEWVGAGPKQYAFRRGDNCDPSLTETVKIRGISLTSNTMKKLNFGTMKK